jgi:RNA polymerase sigma-70 factor (ECF subfamily)
LAEAPHEPSQPEEPEAEFVELISALGQLSPSDQELLRLSAWDGLTREEIARVLGIKANAVDQRIHRARNRLKSRLDRLGNEASSLTHKETPA